ncbi:GspH/FimT family pseudopilin [Pseudorhodoferax sp.]|uniref:GspH/FimT family pseudopilin n=1 Tax=Pseudorhodoferax sp. TaxID=1993553 RepID=UPI002DD6AF56|nr:GspH/FimT family protein [Pseudorhodoferax sp.]
MLCPLRGPFSSCAARGFTMLELMVVVAILAVLAALAGPNMVPVIERWRVRQAVEEMTTTIAYARSEAIKRGGNVVVLRTTPETSQCGLPSSVADWRCGWTVFDDLNGNGALDDGETLRVSPPSNGVSATNANASGASFAITRWGEAQGGGTLTFVFASTRTGSTVKTALCMGGGGRVRTKQGATTCD